MTLAKQVRAYRNACYPGLWITTFEEARLVNELRKEFNKEIIPNDTVKEIASKTNVYEWNSIDGLYSVDSNKKISYVQKTADPIKLITEIGAIVGQKDVYEKFFLLKDFHLQLDRALDRTKIITAFKKIIPVLKERRSVVVFVAPINKIPLEISKDVQVVDYALPDETIIGEKLDDIETKINVILEKKGSKTKLVLSPEIRKQAIEAAKGLTLSEVDQVFSLAITSNKQFNEAFVKTVFDEKILQVKKTGLLTHIDTNVTFDEVGGLKGVKNWIIQRKIGFTEKAREYRLPYPKGMGLAGVQGAGKTLLCRAVAHALGCPLFKLDLSALFNKHVGETEQNMIQMIKIVEAFGPCVLMIDEIEKYLNAGAVSGKGDSGTSSRLFGTFMTWLSDRTNPAFIVATSNDYFALPPALVRKGRFDEWFWVDLATLEERTEIFKVVLKHYNLDESEYNIEELATGSDGFTGSEIDAMCQNALFKALSEEKPMSMDYFMSELADSVAQSKSNEEYINRMRNETKGKLRSAS